MTSFCFSDMEEKLPPCIARRDVEKYFGGTITPKGLANADSQGLGPKLRCKVGRTVVYETKSLLEWLDSRSKSVKE